MDRVTWGITTFRKANRNLFTLPFSVFMRKHAQVDPLEAAPRLRHRKQEPKK